MSVKTVDTAGSSWVSRMEIRIRDLDTRSSTIDGNPANMVLDLRVQFGESQSASQLIQFGQDNGVTVIIKEF